MQLQDLEATYATEDAQHDLEAASRGQAKSTYLGVKSFVKVGRDLQRQQ
jgi:hypothetical protein